MTIDTNALQYPRSNRVLQYWSQFVIIKIPVVTFSKCLAQSFLQSLRVCVCVCIEMSLDFVRIMILNNKHDHSVLSYRVYALLRRTLRIVQCVSHREIFRQTDSDSTQTDASLIRFRELDKETLPTESDNIYYLTNRFL